MSQDIFDVIRKRRSIRIYKKKPVPPELVAKVLEAATFAPSAGNEQPWEFVVVYDDELKKKLWEAALKQDHVRDAPVVIVVCGDLMKASEKYGIRGERLYVIQDVAAAIQNMLLAAHFLGLGSCWVGAFDEEEVKLLCALPDHLRPLALITLGYPDESPDMPTRVPFEHKTWINQHGKKWEHEIKTFEMYVEELKKMLKQKLKELEKKEPSRLQRLAEKLGIKVKVVEEEKED